MNSQSDNNKMVTRYYNSIHFIGDRVIKGTPSERHIKETEWFKEAAKRIPQHIPHIYDFDSKNDQIDTANQLKYYEMESISGSNLYQWAIQNKKIASASFDQLILLAKKIHTDTYPSKDDDIFHMYLHKPLSSLTDFLRLSQIDSSSLRINGVLFPNPIQKLEQEYKKYQSRLLDTRYSFIHGDLTMSNTLRNTEGKLYIIDPRGSFGNTQFFGDVRYDAAKIYYSIVGNFDSLNTGNFSYEDNGNNSYTYSITDNGFGYYKHHLAREMGQDLDLIEYIHSTIWLSLIPHVSNNHDQQMATFCHGVYLLNNVHSYE